MTQLLMVFVLGFSIFVHELGHFLLLKRANILVHEFAIGFGPKLFSWGKGETKFSLRVLPLGGFVLPATEMTIKKERILKEDENEEEAIKNSISLKVNLEEKANLIKLNKSAEVINVKGTRTLMVSEQTYNVPGRNVEDAKETQKLAYILAGVGFNFVFALLFIMISLFIVAGQDGWILANWYNPFLIILDSFLMLFAGLWEMILFIGGLFTGQGLDNISSVVGIVGESESIVDSINQEANNIVVTYMWLFISININLIILNLLPIPPLDGFKIYSSIYTLITKKKMKPELEEKVTNISVMILLVLFGFLILKDVMNFF